MNSTHDHDDRWLAALAGQAEPDDTETRQAASLRRYLELQDEREAPLERKAAGRMARQLRAGLAAAQTAANGPVTPPASAARPETTMPAQVPAWWSRWRAWCFPPMQGHSGHYAAAAALAMTMLLALMVGPGLWPGAEQSAAGADERLAMVEPARPVGAKATPPGTTSAAAPTETPNAKTATASVNALTELKRTEPVAAKPALPDATSVTAQADKRSTGSAISLGEAARVGPATSSAGGAAAPGTLLALRSTPAPNSELTSRQAADHAARNTADRLVLAPGAAPIDADRRERLAALSQRQADAAPARAKERAAAADASMREPATAVAQLGKSIPASQAESARSSTAAAATMAAAPLVEAAPAPATAPAQVPAATARTADASPGATAAAEVASAATSPIAPASAIPQRQHLNVPRPANTVAQIEELLHQGHVAYTLRVNSGIWLLDADVPQVQRQALIEPLGKLKLALPGDGKLRVRIVPAH